MGWLSFPVACAILLCRDCKEQLWPDVPHILLRLPKDWILSKIQAHPQGTGWCHQIAVTAHCNESFSLLESWKQSLAHPTLASFSRQPPTRIQESAFTVAGISSQKNPKTTTKDPKPNQPTKPTTTKPHQQKHHETVFHYWYVWQFQSIRKLPQILSRSIFCMGKIVSRVWPKYLSPLFGKKSCVEILNRQPEEGRK